MEELPLVSGPEFHASIAHHAVDVIVELVNKVTDANAPVECWVRWLGPTSPKLSRKRVVFIPDKQPVDFYPTESNVDLPSLCFVSRDSWVRRGFVSVVGGVCGFVSYVRCRSEKALALTMSADISHDDLRLAGIHVIQDVVDWVAGLVTKRPHLVGSFEILILTSNDLYCAFVSYCIAAFARKMRYRSIMKVD